MFDLEMLLSINDFGSICPTLDLRDEVDVNIA